MRYCSVVLATLVFSLVACSPPTLPAVTSSDGVSIRYDVFGEEGPTLVLVHGWSHNRTSWGPLVPRLSQDYRVVTLDLAGFGESGNDRDDWTMPRFGQDVAAVVEALDLHDVYLVGHSMGAAAALEAADAIPDRVAGVVFVDIFQNPKQEYTEEYIQGWIASVRAAFADPEALRPFIAPNAPDSLVRRAFALVPDPVPDYWWEAVSSFFSWSNTDLTRLLQQMRVPVAAINAEVPPTDVGALQEFAPTFSVRTVPGVGHVGVIWMELDLFQQHLAEIVSGSTAAGEDQ